MLLLICLILAAGVVLLVFVLSIRRPRSSPADTAQVGPAPAVPLYVMATMPDGSQQMVQVAQQSARGGPVPGDAPSFGFATLGFFFPVVGLILFLVWKDQTPLKSRSAGKGALIGVITSVVLSILTVVITYVVFS